jgi:hypothetical protein
MKTVKKTAEYTVLKRTDGRFAVKSAHQKFINGEDKVKILMAEGFLTAPAPKAVAEETPAEAEEATATEAAAE